MSDPVEEFLASYSPQVRALALQVRELVRGTIPEAAERVYPGWKNIGYSVSDKTGDQICYIAPLTSGVNVGFNRGAELPDPNGLLTGTGKQLRHVKIKKAEDIDAPALRALLESAVARAQG